MNFANFHFADPGWLWLAVLAPLLLAVLHHRAATARRADLARMVAPHFAQELTASHSPSRRRFKEVLLLAVFALAGVALARPQWGKAAAANRGVGEDVMFVLDCSRSMLATDVLPNRLQRAKYAILEFVQRYGRGRVGLVAFAGSAFTECPLTFDYGAFDGTLLAMDANTIPNPGTDIGRALKEAYHDFDQHSQRKLIVLLTDGGDLSKTGVTTAKALATNGVVVFTIGVGTPAGKEIWYVNSAGRRVLVRNAKGQAVRSRLDERTLREIAEATGGHYYPLGPRNEGLMQVRSAVHALDTSGGRRPAAVNGVDHYQLPVALALVLIVAESLISTRKRLISEMS